MTQNSAIFLSVHTVELGVLSDEANSRSKCPAIVFRDSFPFEIIRHKASEQWVICYRRPCKRSVWIFVSAHFPSGAYAPRVLPFVSSLSAALKTLENKFWKFRREIFCGADANVQFNMIEDDAGKLGPVQIQTMMQSERAKSCHVYDWLLAWNLRAANTFSSFDNINNCGTRMTNEEVTEGGPASRQLDYIFVSDNAGKDISWVDNLMGFGVRSDHKPVVCVRTFMNISE